MKRIPLTRGLFATVDDCDYDELARHKWCANKIGGKMYAVRGVYNPADQKTTILLMHREILKPKDGECGDHINHDGLDNRRGNLRACSVAENVRNRSGLNKNSTTGYRGVTFCKASRKYIAQIMVNRKNIRVGSFDSAADASMAYKRSALKLFGEFAGGA